MKKLLLVLLTFTLVFTLAACAGNGEAGTTKVGGDNFLKYVDGDYEELKTISAIAKLDSFEGYDVIDDSANLVYLGKQDAEAKTVSSVVYDVLTGQTVWSDTVTMKEYSAEANADNTMTAKTVEFDSANDVNFFIETTYKVTLKEIGEDEEIVNYALYDEKGTKIAESAEDPDYYIAANGFAIVFNGTAYLINEDNASITKAFDIDEFGYFADPDPEYFISYDNGQFMVAFTNGSDITGITFLNSEGKFISNYFVRTDLEMAGSAMLQNGNVVFQYVRELPETAEDYDCFAYGDKVDIITDVFNSKKGTVKSVDLDFIITNNASYIELKEGSKVNALEVVLLDNKYMSSEPEYAIIDNDLNIKCILSDVANGGIVGINIIADNTFAVYDKNGIIHIVDNKGNVKKTIPSMSNFDTNEKFAWTDDAVYTLPSFDKIYDLKVNGQTVRDDFDDYLILEKIVEDADGNEGVELTRLTAENASAPAVIFNTLTDTNASFSAIYSLNLYVVRRDNTSEAAEAPQYVFEVYNNAGTKLLSIESNAYYFSYTIYGEYEGGNVLLNVEGTFYNAAVAQPSVSE